MMTWSQQHHSTSPPSAHFTHYPTFQSMDCSLGVYPTSPMVYNSQASANVSCRAIINHYITHDQQEESVFEKAAYEDPDKVQSEFGVYCIVGDEKSELSESKLDDVSSDPSSSILMPRTRSSYTPFAESENNKESRRNFQHQRLTGKVQGKSRVPEVPEFDIVEIKSKRSKEKDRDRGFRTCGAEKTKEKENGCQYFNRARHLSTPSSVALLKPPVLPKPSLSLPQQARSENSMVTQSYDLRPLSMPLTPYYSEAKRFGIDSISTPTNRKNQRTISRSCDDTNGDYEVPVVPNDLMVNFGCDRPLSAPKSYAERQSNDSNNMSIPCLQLATSVTKMSSGARTSRSSEMSTSSRRESGIRDSSECSNCTQWEYEELEKDFSDFENEYVEITADSDEGDVTVKESKDNSSTKQQT